MRLDLSNLFYQHACPSFAKQLHLANLVGELDWHFNMASGLLSFEPHYRWQAQILGTESMQSNTWLWAWANEASQIPLQIQGAARMIRLLGEAHQIPELSEPEFSLDQSNGHILAMIACGICRSNGYYRCPYEGGAAYLLIKDENVPRCSMSPLTRIATTFPQFISSMDIDDHRLAFTSYLDFHGLTYFREGDAIVIRTEKNPKLKATFDEFNRLTNLEVNHLPGMPEVHRL